MRLNKKICATIALSGMIAIFLSFVIAKLLLNGALEREARLTGLDWAHHIENRLSSFSHVEQPGHLAALTDLPSASMLRRLVSDVFEIGHMYQFDYINIVCHCHVTLSALSPPSDGGGQTASRADLPIIATHGNLDGHGTQDRAGRNILTSNAHSRKTTAPYRVEPVPEGLWEHVNTETVAHPDPISNQSGEHQYPVDRDRVVKVVAQKEAEITLRRDVNAELPSTFAEVYHPVISGSEVLYVMRVIVNLEKQAALYETFMWRAVGVSALILALAIGYPTWHFVEGARNKKMADKRIKFLANHDVLTNLYNRNNFQETVSDMIWSCHEKGQSALIFLFDLNGFKEINDYHGHPVGDRMLCAFAALLKENVPEDSYIARLGGDEFVVVIGGIEEENPDFQEYLSLPKSVDVPVHNSNQVATATVSGGVAQYPRDAETTEELIQLVDLALYAAKPYKAGLICEYTPEMKEAFFDRLHLREEFRLALQASQIEPHYQPIVNMKTGEVAGFEALARWNHPEKGLLSPFVFAEVFNDVEICAELGQQILSKMLLDMRDWHDASVPFVKVGMNVTDGDLKPDSFAQDVLEKLDNHGLPASSLTIEVTENCLFGKEKKNSIRQLQTLREAGCSIALDDFGTGYSSITQLKSLPFTIVKIDKSFIDDVLDNEDDQSIISAMLELGKSMKFDLVMEGIETSQQLALLRFMGSELAQGYYFSRPMPAAEVPAFIARQNSGYEPDTARKKAS